MKNFILYYYNLEITDYISQDTYYYIETKTDIYYFCKVRKSEEDFGTRFPFGAISDCLSGKREEYKGYSFKNV